jgi:hypothetical protein
MSGPDELITFSVHCTILRRSTLEEGTDRFPKKPTSRRLFHSAWNKLGGNGSLLSGLKSCINIFINRCTYIGSDGSGFRESKKTHM